jgi:hypothetical protein
MEVSREVHHQKMNATDSTTQPTTEPQDIWMWIELIDEY